MSIAAFWPRPQECLWPVSLRLWSINEPIAHKFHSITVRKHNSTQQRRPTGLCKSDDLHQMTTLPLTWPLDAVECFSTHEHLGAWMNAARSIQRTERLHQRWKPVLFLLSHSQSHRSPHTRAVAWLRSTVSYISSICCYILHKIWGF